MARVGLKTRDGWESPAEASALMVLVTIMVLFRRAPDMTKMSLTNLVEM